MLWVFGLFVVVSIVVMVVAYRVISAAPDDPPPPDELPFAGGRSALEVHLHPGLGGSVGAVAFVALLLSLRAQQLAVAGLMILQLFVAIALLIRPVLLVTRDRIARLKLSGRRELEVAFADPSHLLVEDDAVRVDQGGRRREIASTRYLSRGDLDVLKRVVRSWQGAVYRGVQDSSQTPL